MARHTRVNQRIGKNLQRIRQVRGETRHTVANMLDVPAIHVCELELGRRALTIAQALTIARYFGCTLQQVADQSPLGPWPAMPLTDPTL